jgi:hypothetical protein
MSLKKITVRNEGRGEFINVATRFMNMAAPNNLAFHYVKGASYWLILFRFPATKDAEHNQEAGLGVVNRGPFKYALL